MSFTRGNGTFRSPTRLAFLALAGGLLLQTACLAGGESDDELVDESFDDIRWNTPNALITEHIAWHSAPCGRNGGRACTSQGSDFLTFHRGYIARLKQAAVGQLTADQMAGWVDVPYTVRHSSAWNDRNERDLLRLQATDRAAFCGISPNLNAFGSFIENGVHGAMHRASAMAIGCPLNSTNGDCIIISFMSPRSSIFLQIHGLIEGWNTRYQNECL